MGFIEVVEGRALRFKDGEFIDSESFSMRSRWGAYYGNKVHNRTVYSSNLYDDEDYWYGSRSNHTATGRTWTKDPETGVYKLNTGETGDKVSSFIGAYTDTKRGVRVYYGAGADERMDFLGFTDETEELPSAYGKYIKGNTKNRTTLEFHPWPGMSDQFNTEESVLEDLLFLTVDMERDSIPDSVRYEITQLNGKLQRKSGKSTNPDLKRDGVRFGDGWAVEHGKLINPDGNVIEDGDTIPHYLKVAGVWYYQTFDQKNPKKYELERSSFQADSDHVNPRAISPPAAITADGKGLADYCLIRENVWGLDENGEWSDLGLKAADLSPEDLLTLGLSYDPLADDNDTDYTLADFERLQRIVAAVEAGGEPKAIEARKVG
jgi:hypothetical protein